MVHREEAGGDEGMKSEKQREPKVTQYLGHEKEPAFYSNCCRKAWEAFVFVCCFLNFYGGVIYIKCTALKYKVCLLTDLWPWEF